MRALPVAQLVGGRIRRRASGSLDDIPVLGLTLGLRLVRVRVGVGGRGIA
jgi:hypothetical protein